MDRCVILIDNSNLFIGGQKLSSRRNGNGNGRKDPAPDPSWRMHFDRLIEVLAKGRPVEAAILAGSTPPASDDLWHAAKQSGLKVVLHDRASGGEKAVDTELVARGSELIAESDEPMVLVLGSGDLDFLPLVELAHRHGWEVELAAFSESFDPKGRLAKAVDRVRPLDDVFERIGYRA